MPTGSEEMNVREDTDVVATTMIVTDTGGIFFDRSDVSFRNWTPNQIILDNDQDLLSEDEGNLQRTVKSFEFKDWKFDKSLNNGFKDVM